MLIRIGLIIAILAGIGAGILGFTQIKPRIEKLQQDLVAETKERISQTKRAEKAEKSLADTRKQLSDEKEAHAATRRDLEQARTQLAGARKEIKDLQGQLQDALAKKHAAEQELEAYTNTGLKPEDIKRMIEDFKQEREKSLALANEVKHWNSEYTKVKRLYDNLRRPENFGYEEGVPMIAGLKAKVTAVDPKWEFVVLDIGRNQEALVGGNMVIYRDGTLIAKVKIREVFDDTCVAIVMPGWKLVDIMEGDQALH